VTETAVDVNTLLEMVTDGLKHLGGKVYQVGDLNRARLVGHIVTGSGLRLGEFVEGKVAGQLSHFLAFMLSRLPAHLPFFTMSSEFSFAVPSHKCRGLKQSLLSHLWQTNLPSGICPLNNWYE
jgi:hypothetical protein